MKDNTTLGPLVGIGELEERWGIKRESILTRIKSGELRAAKLGKSWKFRPEDITAYEERQFEKGYQEREAR